METSTKTGETDQGVTVLEFWKGSDFITVVVDTHEALLCSIGRHVSPAGGLATLVVG